MFKDYTKPKSILVLGGTRMLGKNFVESLEHNDNYNLVLANRGLTNKNIHVNIPKIIIDRDSQTKCEALKNQDYDIVVDFSAHNVDHFVNSISYIKYDLYVLISSLGVLDPNISNPNLWQNNRVYYDYILNKYNLEQYVLQSDIQNLLIIRPGYVYGHDDYTGRFEYKDGDFYWKNTTKLVRESPGSINVKNLSLKIKELIENYTFGSAQIANINQP